MKGQPLLLNQDKHHGYSIITLNENIENNSTLLIKYKTSKDYKEKTKNILGIENIEKYKVEYNTSLLRWEGSGLSDSTMTMLYSLGGVVIFIIIVSSIFVIKNSFSISITEKIKQYGILSSIGATSKQIKKNVLFEGFVLGIIAIPLGILCGMFAVFVLIHLMNFILAEALNGITFVYKVPYLPILITILFSSITIYFSSIFSARKAGKISPIEAIRSNSEIKISSKKVRGSKIIKRIFKIGGDISYKNLKRNKRKYRTTVISLIVSITIFISLSSFIDFGFKMSNEYYKEMNYNFIIYNRQNIEENKENANNFFEEISKNDNVDEYTIYKTKNFLSKSENYSDFGKKYYGDSEADIRLIAVGEEEYKKVLKKIGLDIDECENKGILYDNTTVFENQKKKNGNIYDIKNNSKLTLNFVDKDGIKTEEQLEIDIIKREEKVYPRGLSEEVAILVSDKFIEKLDYKQNIMYVMSNNTNALSEEINNLKKSNDSYNMISYSDLEASRRSENAMVLVISIFLYGFIAVITLIGVTNIFNTITTNMNLRQKEFAMLKSIGMTKKEFDRMIRLESIFYGFKSLIIGIPLGILGSYFVYKAFSEGMEMSYRLPIMAIIIAIIFVFLIIGLIMKYSLSRINKHILC